MPLSYFAIDTSQSKVSWKHAWNSSQSKPVTALVRDEALREHLSKKQESGAIGKSDEVRIVLLAYLLSGSVLSHNSMPRDLLIQMVDGFSDSFVEILVATIQRDVNVMRSRYCDTEKEDSEWEGSR